MKTLLTILTPAVASALVAFLSYPTNLPLVGFAFAVGLGLSCSISRMFSRD